jgi:hypothetical protein
VEPARLMPFYFFKFGGFSISAELKEKTGKVGKGSRAFFL